MRKNEKDQGLVDLRLNVHDIEFDPVEKAWIGARESSLVRVATGRDGSQAREEVNLVRSANDSDASLFLCNEEVQRAQMYARFLGGDSCQVDTAGLTAKCLKSDLVRTSIWIDHSRSLSFEVHDNNTSSKFRFLVDPVKRKNQKAEEQMAEREAQTSSEFKSDFTCKYTFVWDAKKSTLSLFLNGVKSHSTQVGRPGYFAIIPSMAGGVFSLNSFKCFYPNSSHDSGLYPVVVEFESGFSASEDFVGQLENNGGLLLGSIVSEDKKFAVGFGTLDGLDVLTKSQKRITKYFILKNLEELRSRTDLPEGCLAFAESKIGSLAQAQIKVPDYRDFSEKQSGSSDRPNQMAELGERVKVHYVQKTDSFVLTTDSSVKLVKRRQGKFDLRENLFDDTVTSQSQLTSVEIGAKDATNLLEVLRSTKMPWGVSETVLNSSTQSFFDEIASLLKKGRSSVLICERYDTLVRVVESLAGSLLKVLDVNSFGGGESRSVGTGTNREEGAHGTCDEHEAMNALFGESEEARETLPVEDKTKVRGEEIKTRQFYAARVLLCVLEQLQAKAVYMSEKSQAILGKAYSTFFRLISFAFSRFNGRCFLELARNGLFNSYNTYNTCSHFLQDGFPISGLEGAEYKNHSVFEILSMNGLEGQSQQDLLNIPLSSFVNSLPSINFEASIDVVCQDSASGKLGVVLKNGDTFVYDTAVGLVLNYRGNLRDESHKKRACSKILEKKTKMLINLDGAFSEKVFEAIAVKAETHPDDVEPDPIKLEQLYQMGFTIELARKALIKTKNQSLDQALELLTNIEDEFNKAEDRQELETAVSLLKPVWECSACTIFNETSEMELKDYCHLCHTPAPLSAYYTKEEIEGMKEDQQKMVQAQIENEKRAFEVTEAEKKGVKVGDELEGEVADVKIGTLSTNFLSRVVLVGGFNQEGQAVLRVRRAAYCTEYIRELLKEVTESTLSVTLFKQGNEPLVEVEQLNQEKLLAEHFRQASGIQIDSLIPQNCYEGRVMETFDQVDVKVEGRILSLHIQETSRIEKKIAEEEKQVSSDIETKTIFVLVVNKSSQIELKTYQLGCKVYDYFNPTTTIREVTSVVLEGKAQDGVVSSILTSSAAEVLILHNNRISRYAVSTLNKLSEHDVSSIEGIKRAKFSGGRVFLFDEKEQVFEYNEEIKSADQTEEAKNEPLTTSHALSCDDILNFMHQKKYTMFKVNNYSDSPILWSDNPESNFTFESKLIVVPGTKKLRFALETKEKDIKNGIVNVLFNFNVPSQTRPAAQAQPQLSGSNNSSIHSLEKSEEENFIPLKIVHQSFLNINATNILGSVVFNNTQFYTAKKANINFVFFDNQFEIDMKVKQITINSNETDASDSIEYALVFTTNSTGISQKFDLRFLNDKTKYQEWQERKAAKLDKWEEHEPTGLVAVVNKKAVCSLDHIRQARYLCLVFASSNTKKPSFNINFIGAKGSTVLASTKRSAEYRRNTLESIDSGYTLTVSNNENVLVKPKNIFIECESNIKPVSVYNINTFEVLKELTFEIEEQAVSDCSLESVIVHVIKCGSNSDNGLKEIFESREKRIDLLNRQSKMLSLEDVSLVEKKKIFDMLNDMVSNFDTQIAQDIHHSIDVEYLVSKLLLQKNDPALLVSVSSLIEKFIQIEEFTDRVSKAVSNTLDSIETVSTNHESLTNFFKLIDSLTLNPKFSSIITHLQQLVSRTILKLRESNTRENKLLRSAEIYTNPLDPTSFWNLASSSKSQGTADEFNDYWPLEYLVVKSATHIDIYCDVKREISLNRILLTFKDVPRPNPDVFCFVSLYKVELNDNSWEHSKEHLIFTKEVNHSFLFYTSKQSREQSLTFYHPNFFNSIGYRVETANGRYFRIRLTFDSSKHTKAFYKVNKQRIEPLLYGISREPTKEEAKTNLPQLNENITAKLSNGETGVAKGSIKNKTLASGIQAAGEVKEEGTIDEKSDGAVIAAELNLDNSRGLLRDCLSVISGETMTTGEITNIKEIVESTRILREKQSEKKSNFAGGSSFNFWLSILNLAGGGSHISKNSIDLTYDHFECLFENIILSNSDKKVQDITLSLMKTFIEKESVSNALKLVKKLISFLSTPDKIQLIVKKNIIAILFNLFRSVKDIQVYELVKYILTKLCKKFPEDKQHYLIQMNWTFDFLFLFVDEKPRESLTQEEKNNYLTELLSCSLNIILWMYEQEELATSDKILLADKAIVLFNQIFKGNRSNLHLIFKVEKPLFEMLLIRSFQLNCFANVEPVLESIYSLGAHKESEVILKDLLSVFSDVLTQVVGYLKDEESSNTTISGILKGQKIEESRYLEFLCFLIKYSDQISKKIELNTPEEIKEGTEETGAKVLGGSRRKKMTAEEMAVKRSLSISSQNKDLFGEEAYLTPSTIKDLLSLYTKKYRNGTANPNLLIQVSKLILSKNSNKEYLKLFFELYMSHSLSEKTLVTNQILENIKETVDNLKKVKIAENEVPPTREFCSSLLDSLSEIVSATGLENLDSEFFKIIIYVQEMIIGPEAKKGMAATIDSLVTPLSLSCVASIFFLSAKELNRLCNWGGPDGFDSLDKSMIVYLDIIMNFLSIVTVATSNTKAIILSEIATNLKSVNLEKISTAVYNLIEWNVFNNIATAKKSPAMDRLNKIIVSINKILQGLSEYPETGKIIIKRLFDIVNEVHSHLMPKINSGEINFIGINFIYNLFGFLEKILDWTLKDSYMINFFTVECKGIHFVFDLLNVSYETSSPEEGHSRANVETILVNLLSSTSGALVPVLPADTNSAQSALAAKLPSGGPLKYHTPIASSYQPLVNPIHLTPTPASNTSNTVTMTPIANNPSLFTTTTQPATTINPTAAVTTTTPAATTTPQVQTTNLQNYKNNIPCNNPDKFSDEFGKEMKCINKINGKEEKTIDWQKNKKGGGKQILFYPMQNEHAKNNRELVMDFQLNSQIDLRTIKTAFLTSYNDYGNKVVAEPSYVYIHYKCKQTDEWKFLCELEKYEDNGYYQGASMCYQKNFMRTEGKNFKERINSVCIPKNIEFLRFLCGKPTISFQENYSQLKSKDYNMLSLAPSFISVLGINSKAYSLQTQNNFIKETTLLRLIQKVFSKDQKSLEAVSNQPDLIERFKVIFERLVDDYVDHFTSPLVSFSRSNKDFGLWVMKKLLDLRYKEEHAKVVGEIIMSTVDLYQERIGLLCDFIIRQIDQGVSSNAERLYSFMTVFASCLHKSPNDEKFASKYTLNVDEREINILVQFFMKISYVQQYKNFFITLVYLPNPAFRLKIENPMDYLMEKLSTSITRENEFVLAELLSLLALSKRVYAERILEENIADFLFKQFDKMDPKGMISVLLFFRNIINHETCKKKIIDIKLPEHIYNHLKTLVSAKEQNNEARIQSNMILGLDIIKFIISTDPKSATKFSYLLHEACKNVSGEANEDTNSFLESIFFPILFTIKTHKVFFEKKVQNKPQSIFDDRLEMKEVKEDTNFNLKSDYLPSELVPTLFSNIDYLVDNSTKEKFKNGNWSLIGNTQATNGQDLSHSIEEHLIGQGAFLLLVDGEASNQEYVMGVFCSSGLAKDPKATVGNREITVSNSDNHFIFLYEKSSKPNPVSCHYKTKSNNDSELFLKYNDKQEANEKGIMVYYTNLEKIFLSFSDPNTSHIDLYPMKCLESDPQPQFEFPFDFRIKKGVEIWKLSLPEGDAGSKESKASSMFLMTPLNLMNEILNISYSYYRDSTVYNVPSSITLDNLKKVLFSDESVQFKYSNTQKAVDGTLTIEDIKKDNQAKDELDLIDLEYNKNIEVKDKSTLEDLKDLYVPKTPILDNFVAQGAMDSVLTSCEKILKTSPQWVGKPQAAAWEQIIYEINLFKKIEYKEANFMLSFVQQHASLQILFKIIFPSAVPIPDKQWQANEEIVVASIYSSLGNLLKEVRQTELRDFIIKSGIFEKILERLQSISKETSRKYQEEVEVVEEKKEEDKKKEEEQKGVIKRKGVGYEGVTNTNWSTDEFFKLAETKNKKIQALLTIIINSLDVEGWDAPEGTLKIVCESCLLPLIENAFRCTSLLDLAKDRKLYELYLSICRALAKTESLMPSLVDLDKRYVPNQISSIEKLLSLLSNGAETFKKLTLAENKDQKSLDDNTKIAFTLSEEIIKTFEAVKTSIDSSSKYKNRAAFDLKAIEALPMEAKYKTLLETHRFGYVNMKDQKDATKYIHHYKSSFTGKYSPQPSKMVRLAQEIADISNSLPVDSTNAMFVRADEERLDVMKAVIFGAEGCPYAHGAFEYHIYFDNEYPNGPPKCNLETTGKGDVRFNPNLYNCGKVCLSLLGTWRGNASENWDPKFSTLSQVLVSIQAVVMSEEVYFNEPGYGQEAGTEAGELKNTGYSNIVRLCNVKYGMIGQIETPTRGFENVIRTHFVLKKEKILKTVKEWNQLAQEKEATYTGLVADHNPTYCDRFKNKPTAYAEELATETARLEKVLDSLEMPPIEALLGSKAGSLKMGKEKKEKVDIADGQANLDEIDVRDDETITHRDMTTDEAGVKDRWSRYIGVMGMESVKKQANASVFISGLSSLGVEVAKNLILSGVKRITLHDTKNTVHTDLAGQFFLGENDIGKNRAEACRNKIQQLNFYVKVDIGNSNLPLPETQEELEKIGLADYEVVLLVDSSHDTIDAVSRVCRAHNRCLIVADCHGVFSRVFCDFGPKFVCFDKNGEEAQEVMVSNITNEENGKVTLLEGVKHMFEDGDTIVLRGVEGMTLEPQEEGGEDKSINGVEFKVKIINYNSFFIGDTTKFSKYVRGGLAKQIKLPFEIEFKPYHEIYTTENPKFEENLVIHDFMKLGHSQVLHLCYLALTEFETKQKRYPNPYNIEDAHLFVEIALKKAATMEKLVDLKDNEKLLRKLAYRFSTTLKGNFGPQSAYIGGMVCQEIVKAITGKFRPIHQAFYADSIEVLEESLFPENMHEIKQADYEKLVGEAGVGQNNTRDDGIRMIVGQKLLEKIKYSTLFMVGSGAIGCELLKNYSMISLGTGNSDEKHQKAGQIILTDPDIIEVSNLNRQFLFRERHLRKPKSTTAAAAAQVMNPDLKGHLLARLDKVHEGTSNIFTDEFFERMTIVTNALDNIQARKYIDARCVTARTPLIESGTLGPKGHVQVILPNKTESYGSMKDPVEELDIPHCTLKMFPEETLHCIEWARDLFGNLFTQSPQALRKCLEDLKEGNLNPQEIKALKDSLKLANKAPKNFEDCVIFARHRFQKYFNYDIKQLLYVYPLDYKDKEGVPFWKLPKRPPTPLEFDPKDKLHIDFIASMSFLHAKIFSCPIPVNIGEEKTKQEIAERASKIKMNNFKPSDEKAKEISKDIEKQNNKKVDEMGEKEEPLPEEYKEISFEEVKSNFVEKTKSLTPEQIAPEEFEKDDDQNRHIDVIHAMTNLRASNYKLDQMDWIGVKLKAGRIVPALATTTASIAGLQTLELVKVLKEIKVEDVKNAFLNLAVPILTQSEPGEAPPVKLTEKLTVTLWDRWEVKDCIDKTLKDVFDHIEKEYQVFPRDVIQGAKSVYMRALGGKETLAVKLGELFNAKKGEYEDLTITCSLSETENKILQGVPPVRLMF